MKRAIAALALALLVSGCFPDPVEETLVIRFGDEDELTVESVVQIHDDSGASSPLEARLESVRDELLAERDSWSLRFARLTPATEEYRRERAAGKIARVTRVARIDEGDLAKLLSDFATLNIVEGEGWRELSLNIGHPERATSRQRADVDRQLNEWSTKYATYLAATMRLYAYVDREPMRAQPMFAVLFADLMPEPAPEDAPVLSDDEREIVNVVRGSMDELSNAMSAQDSAAYTFEELTRLVYDPIPADITIRTNGSVLETEGFRRVDAETVSLPKLSIEGSLLRLENRWISPDPFLARLSVNPDEKPFDLDAFLSQERGFAQLPSPQTIRLAVDEVLTPAKSYRVRWEER